MARQRKSCTPLCWRAGHPSALPYTVIQLRFQVTRLLVLPQAHSCRAVPSPSPQASKQRSASAACIILVVLNEWFRLPLERIPKRAAMC